MTPLSTATAREQHTEAVWGLRTLPSLSDRIAYWKRCAVRLSVSPSIDVHLRQGFQNAQVCGA